ncbi:MAG: hypothetical protein J6W87_02380 [Clostridia bacterium]|nr:hypothetical protein [Clostridia bacterium]
MNGLNLHDIYGYGQLFCFSGLEGETSVERAFIGVLMNEPITVRFHFDEAVILRIPLADSINFSAITGDMIDGENIFVAFYDKDTVVGKVSVMPTVLTEGKSERTEENGEEVITTSAGRFFLTVKKEDGYFYFSFAFGKRGALLTERELNELKEKRYAYFKRLPKCKDAKYDKMYYKCLSVNKENVCSAEGEIPCRWSTPDRIPHRYMWLWDSAFYAMTFAQYNLEMAKDCVRSVLSLQRKDGFISHMMSPRGCISKVTQPQVLAWSVWAIYQNDKDKDFLREVAPAIAKFLVWTMKNRDKNGNGLLEWSDGDEGKDCKGGESGMDNSPRFDFDTEMDAIDFSTYLCNDAKYLSMAFEEIGDKQNAEYFASVHESVKEKINTLLWSETDGIYYDRLFDGRLTGFATPASFLPMFAGICTRAQADKMVRVLTDKEKFWTAMPIPSVPRDSEYYDLDMWRGCVWLNFSYFITVGLRKYGYNEIAEELRTRTLDSVAKWYNETGNVFEFYDADGKTHPLRLKRKGEQPETPDYRKHIHAICDFNWSACFTMMLINGIYY